MRSRFGKRQSRSGTGRSITPLSEESVTGRSRLTCSSSMSARTTSFSSNTAGSWPWRGPRVLISRRWRDSPSCSTQRSTPRWPCTGHLPRNSGSAAMSWSRRKRRRRPSRIRDTSCRWRRSEASGNSSPRSSPASGGTARSVPSSPGRESPGISRCMASGSGPTPHRSSLPWLSGSGPSSTRWAKTREGRNGPGWRSISCSAPGTSTPFGT